VLINTPHSPLKEAEIALYGVGVDITSDVFVGGMVDGFVACVWSIEEIVELMDETAPKPGRPKVYKKQNRT